MSSDTRPTLICSSCRQDVTAAARLHEACAENAALRERCERLETENRKLRASWPEYNQRNACAPRAIRLIHRSWEVIGRGIVEYDTRDEAINAAAGITHADAAKGGE
ncbi:hypothetical protein UFOVP124_3 [uncultured Caudovirales phage]|uniref:Uncharacterized protein n=1 Tax=uncultured Caudovirales phage TaxID=2100421 RepID=A0A6J5LAN8_9CAUD|nr:hypothetical protein UFOVP124_3 [uncultured Caudovirales phage]